MKNYGPKGFEKAWTKQLKNFDETKIFFKHTRDNTVLNFISGGQLLGIEMYRCQFEIDRWIGHFQNFLETGVFDTNAYWCEYTTCRAEDGSLKKVLCTEVFAVPMVLKGKIWNEHSKEQDKFMNDQRAAKGDLGFKLVSRPNGPVTLV